MQGRLSCFKHCTNILATSDYSLKWLNSWNYWKYKKTAARCYLLSFCLAKNLQKHHICINVKSAKSDCLVLPIFELSSLTSRGDNCLFPDPRQSHIRPCLTTKFKSHLNISRRNDRWRLRERWREGGEESLSMFVVLENVCSLPSLCQSKVHSPYCQLIVAHCMIIE